MKENFTCPSCGYRRVYRVSPVRERGAKNLPQPMAVAFSHLPADWPPLDTRAYGWFEIYVCASCGHTEWFAREFEPDELAVCERVDAPPGVTCAECAARAFWKIDPAPERDHRGEPAALAIQRARLRGDQWHRGSFCTYVCRECGCTAWVARGLDELGGGDGEEVRLVETAPCRACEASWRLVVTTMREVGDAYVTDMHVFMRTAFLYARTAGRFSTSICRACGRTEWIARDLEQLRPHPRHGVWLLEAPRAARGPYR